MPRKTETVWVGESGNLIGFNEAAARCRGKRRRAGRTRRWRCCRFNEAAARCRGKRSILA